MIEEEQENHLQQYQQQQEVEEEQKSYFNQNSHLQINSSNESTIIKENTDQIQIKILTRKQEQRKKRRIRSKYVPLIITNTLKSDQDPIFIYNYYRMMKCYDDIEYNKYKYYGLQDGGVGYFESLQYDKINQTIDISMDTISEGELSYKNLIKLYKSYQNQLYYDLAITLEEYQIWSNNNRTYIQLALEQVQQLPNYNNIFEEIHEQFNQFDQYIKQYMNYNYPNEMYELVLGHVDMNQKRPISKKQIYSQNLIYIIGSDIENMYDLLSQQKNKEVLPNLINSSQFNGLFQLQKNITIIKETMKGSKEFVHDDELNTLDGYIIPCKKQLKIMYYDKENNTLSFQPNLLFVIITFYQFQPSWIKYLIQKREEFNIFNQNSYNQNINQNKQNEKINQNNQNGNTYQNINNPPNYIQQYNLAHNAYDLDYICQKEYFIEKFYPNRIK